MEKRFVEKKKNAEWLDKEFLLLLEVLANVPEMGLFVD
jgi:hypothetical protein